MDKPKFTIADGEFIPYGKSESLGGDNTGIGPTYFDWEPANPKTARFVTDRNIKDAVGPGQIGWLSESFFLHPENYLEAMKKPFDAVLTHNHYFAQNMNWLWFPHGGSWINVDKWGMHPKTKNVSIILSSKNTMPGHKLRHEVAEKFGSQVDVFGLDGYVYKFDALAPYRYSIVIESERCPGFFGEKLIDCLSVGTIPIYWGDPSIQDIFRHGIVEVDGIHGIGFILEELSETDYQSHLSTVERNIEIARKYRISEDWIYTYYPNLFRGAQ